MFYLDKGEKHLLQVEGNQTGQTSSGGGLAHIMIRCQTSVNDISAA